MRIPLVALVLMLSPAALADGPFVASPPPAEAADAGTNDLPLELAIPDFNQLEPAKPAAKGDAQKPGNPQKAGNEKAPAAGTIKDKRASPLDKPQVALVDPPPLVALPIDRGVQPLGQTISSGDLGTLGMPSLAMPEPKHLELGIGFNYYRGGEFLLPDATIQRSAMALGAAYPALPWLEVYGSLAFSSTNQFGTGKRQTLTSLGDTDLGVKLVVPQRGPFSAGALLQLDMPAGVGSFSLKGTGGRAAAMVSLGDDLGPVPLLGTVMLGYVLDNSYQLMNPIGTFPAFAEQLSLWDRAQAALSLESPMRWGAPVAEFQLEAPVARGQDMPSGSHPAHVRLLVGATALGTGVPGLTASAGLAFSLVGTGRPEPQYFPMAGWPPDSPWQAMLTLSYSFEARLPQRKTPVWREEPGAISNGATGNARPQLLGQPVANGGGQNSVAVISGTPIPDGKGRISVQVIDSRTQLPLPNSWVSAIELSDLGTTTGADGHAQLDAPPGQLTLAVAHDGYDPYSDGALVIAGKELEVNVALSPQLNDATVRGKISGEDGKPLRASIELRPAGGPASSVSATEATIYDGVYSVLVPHGAFNVVASAPGYKAAPVRVDLLPGEVATRDVVLRRSVGEPLARATPDRIELSERIQFVAGTAQIAAASSGLLDELARTMSDAGPYAIGVRLDASETQPGDDELVGLLLTEQRAGAVVDALVQRGVPRSHISSHGYGVAHEGQPLLEVKKGAAAMKPAL